MIIKYILRMVGLARDEKVAPHSDRRVSPEGLEYRVDPEDKATRVYTIQDESETPQYQPLPLETGDQQQIYTPQDSLGVLVSIGTAHPSYTPPNAQTVVYQNQTEAEKVVVDPANVDTGPMAALHDETTQPLPNLNAPLYEEDNLESVLARTKGHETHISKNQHLYGLYIETSSNSLYLVTLKGELARVNYDNKTQRMETTLLGKILLIGSLEEENHGVNSIIGQSLGMYKKRKITDDYLGILNAGMTHLKRLIYDENGIPIGNQRLVVIYDAESYEGVPVIPEKAGIHTTTIKRIMS